MSSKIARLKRHLERMGIRGVGDSKDKDDPRDRGHRSPIPGVDGEQQRGSDDDAAGATSHGLPPRGDRHRRRSIVPSLSPSNRGDAKDRSSGGGAAASPWMGASANLAAQALSPRATRSLGASGRRLSAWALGRTGHRGSPSPGQASGAWSASGTRGPGTASRATPGFGSAREGGQQGAVTLSPQLLAEHDRLAAAPSAWTGREGLSARPGGGARSRGGSPMRTAGSREGDADAGVAGGDGGDKDWLDPFGSGSRRQAGERPRGSPVRSVDGSVSSQTMSSRRITRKMSFRKRQAEMNIQVGVIVRSGVDPVAACAWRGGDRSSYPDRGTLVELAFSKSISLRWLGTVKPGHAL